MNCIAVRTTNDLETLMHHSRTHSWICNPSLHPNLTYIEIYNFEGTRKIVANFQYYTNDIYHPSNPNRKILYFSNARIENINVNIRQIFPQNPVRYLIRVE
jgi:hypothetical protein